MLAWLRRQSARRPVPAQSPTTAPRQQLGIEVLEDRTTPTVSTITGNFNGTAIPAGDALWFSNVAKVSGLPASGTVIHVTDQTISFTAGGVQYSLHVPDTTVSLAPGTTNATVVTDLAGDWQVASPSSFSGNVFLSGVAVDLPNGLPGGIKNVTWSGDFKADTTGVKVNWQWAAAAYKQFAATDAAALGVKPSDAKTAAYANSDHAGTPESFKKYVVGGGTGGGGSNWTGSYSATASVTPELTIPAVKVSELSGFVKDNFGAAQSGVHIFLSGKNDLGQAVAYDVWTDNTGMYTFSGLRPGTYTITEVPPSVDGFQYSYTDSFAGQINGQGAYGSPSGPSISNITLGAGQSGTEFDFVNQYYIQG